MARMHVHTWRCGVHHGCVCRYGEVWQEAWLLVRLDSRVHLHAVIQGFSTTGLQEREGSTSMRSMNSKYQGCLRKLEKLILTNLYEKEFGFALHVLVVKVGEDP